MKKNEENSYQIQNKLKKYEILTIDVYYTVEHHGINQSYCVTLKLENLQTLVNRCQIYSCCYKHV